ncbi:MAG: energy transducer TonB [Candidatus Marinarcus sp.]|uniref:energy transducer TonB n=1 Tax=Candidatus Marinarcus sp. TaxID=3100987 RepID=UPI003AFF8C32
MTDKNYFYFSGFIACGFYVLVCLLFFLYLQAHNVKKFDAFSKVTVLELEILSNDQTEKTAEQVTPSDVKNSDLAQDIVKKSTSKSIKETANVKSLFANVSVNSDDVNKEDVLNVEKNAVASRFKSKFEKQRKSESVSVSKLLENVKLKTSKLTFSESKNQNDPYYSKIYEIISSRWQPSSIVDNLSAKVVVTIYSDGKFEYTFISDSGDETFDASLKAFLDEQTTLTYPTHDKGNKTDIEIIFKAKG